MLLLSKLKSLLQLASDVVNLVVQVVVLLDQVVDGGLAVVNQQFFGVLLLLPKTLIVKLALKVFLLVSLSSQILIHQLQLGKKVFGLGTVVLVRISYDVQIARHVFLCSV